MFLLLERFMASAVREGAIGDLGEIFGEYEEILLEKQGAIRAVVRYVTPLTESQQADLRKFIMERFGTSLRNKTQAVFQSEKAMRDIGNVLYMHSAPELKACYIRRVGFRPVILTFAVEDEELILRAYSGRAPLTFISIMHAVSMFEKALPSQIYRKGKKSPDSNVPGRR